MIAGIREEDIVILIPALNEELNIVKTLTSIPLKNCRVIVIDNGSEDNTASLAKANGATVIHELRKGYGFACLAGINYLNNLAEPKYVVFLDADGADDPKGLEKLITAKMHKPEPAMVMGSRLNNLQINAMSPHAVIANKVLIRIINLLYRVKLTDMGPFRIIDYSILKLIHMKDTGYGWSSEMIVKVLKTGHSIREIPVVYRRRLGESKISGSLMTSLKAAIWLSIHIIRHAFRSQSYD